jgi:acylphosphatase
MQIGDAMIMQTQSQLHATVEGHVQGVGFRQFVFQTAINLDLTGWVRNTYEGNVEVMAEGSPDILDTFLDALRKGPRMAFVSQVRYDFNPATGAFADFRVVSTV